MEKFMLILREDCEKFSRMAEEERFLMAPVMLEWIRSIAEAGQYVAGGPLAISGRYPYCDFQGWRPVYICVHGHQVPDIRHPYSS